MYELTLDKWLDIELGDMFDKITEDTDSEFEVEGNTTEIEHESRDGFIPFTNGGLQFTAPVCLNYLTGSGKSFLNETVTDTIDKTVEYCYTGAREAFIEQNRAELNKTFCKSYLDNNSDRINYHVLYDMNRGSLAESLSEMEYSWLDSVVFVEHHAQFYAAENSHNKTGEDEICFLSGVNTDYDYGRDKGLEITFELTVKVGDLTPNKLKEITKDMLASI
jgi:hypothetical protein